MNTTTSLGSVSGPVTGRYGPGWTLSTLRGVTLLGCVL